MKKCKYCQSDIDVKAKICPHCGKKQGMPKWLIVIIVILAIFILLSLGSNSSDTEKNEQTGTTTEKQESLVLEEGHTGSLDEYGVAYYVEGYIQNNTDKDYSYIQVTFTTYDSEGNTIGSCLDNNSSLEANGRWKFKAICLDDVENIASYKLNDITAY